ncbi:MAG: class I SAM-dependent methyltransferase, partial [Phocaeicola sp.]|nr:class I SAM-dependent methyltransferase [Phocaeicola sp.]
IIAKAQPFNVRKGIILTEILPRIPFNDPTYGKTYQERTKNISAHMKAEYARICREKNTSDNPVFYDNLIQNYIYKGPIEEWYIRIKVRMENYYKLFDQLIPAQGRITDIGCGFGPLCYMLSQLSEKREITGIDYDEDKIAVAQHGWLRTPRLQFVCANALEYPLPESDVFILNDMLHYMSYEHQRTLLIRCMERLRPGGKLIVRDGNTANVRKHRLTRFTEILSTTIFRFNKTDGQLCFASEEQIRSIAQEKHMQIEMIPNDRYTSNTIYILKNKPEYEQI